MMKYIAWDFDGTLADSRPLIRAGMSHALKALGLPETVAIDWLACVGLPVEEGIIKTFTPLGLKVEDVVKAYRSYPYAENLDLIHPFEGAHSLLVELQARGIPMSLATSKRRIPLERELKRFGWESFFDIYVTPDDVQAPKPNPESLNLITRHFGCAPTDIVMVGDTTYDLLMAQQAGVPSIAVTYGFHTREQLNHERPLAIVNSIEDLRDVLRAYVP